MKFKPLIIALTAAAFIATLGQSTLAFSLKELLGMEDEGTTAEQPEGGLMENPAPETPAAGAETGQNWGKPSGAVTNAPFELSGLQRVLENVDSSQRAAVLADEATFKRFVQRETDAASLLQAAKANNLHQDPDVTFLMQRGSENILREVYLNRLVTSKVPAGFPTEEQMRQYFEQNKAKLVIPERVQAWQVFFPFEKNADAKAKAAVGQRADSVARDLAQNKITFAEAAQKFSGHEASRQKGGDMGLVSVSDLKPEIKQALLALPEGQVSSPLKTDAGVHIVKRGAKTAAQPLEYEAIKDQIRPLMLKQATAQLRNAILEQARKTYPVEVDAKKIEEFRLRLRTDLAPASGKAASAAP
ncbi:MAG: hypothetical protein A3H91_15470 [Gammaproteobacteria bacterium RIFCSPLOWO2_02_FULL_61_13]|nr:MAG: hypothetical protein A3H91_15470 [Gammaproteobacteria bacterium RIFCSPLOWO2_02_FULL_61_13]